MLIRVDGQYLENVRKQTAGVLEEVAGPDAAVAVLDFPGHDNVGDSMIWAGEIGYLTRAAKPTRYIADMRSYVSGALPQHHPDGPILLHGGGHLGDVWPLHQAHREVVIDDLPERKIVMLPQTVYARDARHAERVNRIFGHHADRKLLVQENQSFERSQGVVD